HPPDTAGADRRGSRVGGSLINAGEPLAPPSSCRLRLGRFELTLAAQPDFASRRFRRLMHAAATGSDPTAKKSVTSSRVAGPRRARKVPGRVRASAGARLDGSRLRLARHRLRAG